MTSNMIQQELNFDGATLNNSNLVNCNATLGTYQSVTLVEPLVGVNAESAVRVWPMQFQALPGSPTLADVVAWINNLSGATFVGAAGTAP